MKGQQIANVPGWRQSRNAPAPDGETKHRQVAELENVDALDESIHDGHGLANLQDTARQRQNVFFRSDRSGKDA